MDVIQTARELGKAIQKDERFLNLMVAQQNNDGDKELQDLIGKFNLQRVELNQVASKEPKDEAKIAELNKQVGELYKQVMDRPTMVAFNEAKVEMDTLMNFVMEILRGSVNGENPDEITESAGCGGDCGGCGGGCH